MSVSLITTTTGSADTAAAGATKINSNYQGQWDEDRLLQVTAVEPATSTTYQLAAGATLNLANITGGPGNIEFIQLAMVVGTGGSGVTDEENTYLNSTIKLTIDGTALTPIPLNVFYLLFGTNPSNGPSPANAPWWTDDFAIMEIGTANPMSFGAFRRLFIPFNSSCKVDLISASTTGYSAQVFSQVQYRLGAIPLRLTGTRRVRFACQYTPLTSISQFGNLNLLNVSGKGQIDSIHLCVFGNSATPTWLEGNPSFTLDGNVAQWGGTEDFFGTQYYGAHAPHAVTNSWACRSTARSRATRIASKECSASSPRTRLCSTHRLSLTSSTVSRTRELRRHRYP